MDPVLALMSFQHGCPCGPIYFRQFCRYLHRKNISPDPATHHVLLDWLIQHGQADLHWDQGPVWVDELCLRYRTRRANCQMASSILCGIAHYSPLFFGSRDIARLIAAYVWATRWNEVWNEKQ
jgi:hypothetical protein